MEISGRKPDFHIMNKLLLAILTILRFQISKCSPNNETRDETWNTFLPKSDELISSVNSRISRIAENPGILAGNDTCPEGNLITPCVCFFDSSDRMKMDCSSVTSDVELHAVFNQPFPTYSFYMLIINFNTNLKFISSGAFGNSTFEYIDIYRVEYLESIDSGIFSNMKETLVRIWIHLCPALTEFIFDFTNFLVLDKVDLFSDSLTAFNIISPTVTVLQLGNNSLQRDKFYANLPNLEELYMDNNNFEEVPDLIKYQNLSIVRFEYNSLTNLTANTSCHPDTLKWIHFEWNNLTNVEVDAICAQNGSYIYLNRNQLTTLNETVYKPIATNVPTGGLILYHNPFDCGCDIYWLFSNNYMDKIDVDTSCKSGTLFTDLDQDLYIALCED